jgi:sigma-B regulation protein RsbU (phosphoserine phosphatase)
MIEEIIFDPPSVLVVDDNAKNLQVLGGFLKIEGLLVEFALDGISALKWLEKKKFDLILLDIMMPGMDGYEVCSIIKKNPLVCDIPVIFITAKTDSESIVRGFDAGAVDYINKPFIQSELLVRVKTQLSIGRSKEQEQHYLNVIEEKNLNISSNIDHAKYIQAAVLSMSEKYLKYLPEHYLVYLPKDTLSGDFYWLYKTGRKLIIAVMDCTGHGVSGALMSILGITLLNESVTHDNNLQPDIILDSLRTKLIHALGQKEGVGHLHDGIEGIVISYDSELKILQYSGSFNPLIMIHSGEMTCVKADMFPIGFYDDNKPFTLHEIKIEENDIIYMFSDGILDQFGGPGNRRFMIKHLKEIFFDNHSADMKLQKEILMKEIDLWRGDQVQTDDIIVMGIRF